MAASRHSQCAMCGKLLYPTEREARAALQHLRQTGRAEQGRVYHLHGGWHITSQATKRNGRSGKATGTLADDPALHAMFQRLKESGDEPHGEVAP
jgi:hypothetical protein